MGSVCTLFPVRLALVRRLQRGWAQHCAASVGSLYDGISELVVHPHVAPRGRRPECRQRGMGDGAGHDRQRDVRTARRIPRRTAREGRDGRRDRRIPRRDPRARHPSSHQSDGTRHRRYGRGPFRHGERVHDGGDRRCRSRRSGDQARQPCGEFFVRLVGCAGGTRHRPRAARREGGRSLRAHRDHVRLRIRFPPGFRQRGTRARRARHPDRLQLPRSALQSGAPRGVRRRRRAPGSGSAHRRRLPDTRCDGPRLPGRRRARRALDHRTQPRVGGLTRPGRPSTTSTRGISASRGPPSPTSSEATRRTTPTSSVPCSPDRKVRCATSYCSTRRRGSYRTSSQPTRRGSRMPSWIVSVRKWLSPPRRSTPGRLPRSSKSGLRPHAER